MISDFRSLIVNLFLLLFVVNFHSSCNSGKSENSIQKSKYENQRLNSSIDSIPLFICGSYFNKAKSIEKDQIVRLLNSGKIFCTSDLTETLKSFFKLSRSPKSYIINQVNLSDDSLLVITSLDSLDPKLIALSVNKVNYFKNPEKYPFYIQSISKSVDFKKDITSYTHTGVTAITRATGRLLDNLSNDDYLKNIKSYFLDREIIHISNEVSISDTCNYNGMKMKFATKAEHFEILKKLRANVIELTGNHNLDVGTKPYLNSLKFYKQNNMSYFGGGANADEAEAPLIKVLKDGKKIAWIGFNELCPCAECTDNKSKMGANRYSSIKAKDVISKLKNEKISYIIACVQYGERDSYDPSPTQVKISKELLDLGADVVIGSQAHQPQRVELYKGKFIFYGLGNFLFDQIHRVGVRQAYFLECYFYKGKIVQFQPVFTYLPPSRIPNIASEQEESEIRKAIFLKH